MAKIGYVMAYKKGQNNYGTSLQGYALLMKMRQLGHDVEIIHYIKQMSVWEKVQWVINSYRCGMARNPLKTIIKPKYPSSYKEGIKQRTTAVDSYKETKLLPFFHDYCGYRALCEGSTNYDAIVVGSDQVWLPLGLTTKFFNLLFVKDNVRKVAYASSFGVHDIPDFQKKDTGIYLDRFYSIGVREQRGKEIVEELSHRHAQVVSDPTLLLTKAEWEKELQYTTKRDSIPYIFCYLISENKEARMLATELAKKKELKIICIRHLEKYREIDDTYGDEAPYDVDPNDFIAYIRDAEYVVTDSFHCTVFSHIFHKPFLTFYRSIGGRNARNNRIDSLITILGSNPQHLYTNGGLEGIDTPIDWNKVEDNLLVLREESMTFLKSSLQ